MRVLLVEDEVKLASYVKRGFKADGHAVDVASDGEDGLWTARNQPYDVIVLDVMLPKRNGFLVCSDLRAESNWTPILMLIADDGGFDVAEALDSGGDDYLIKPFSMVVPAARTQAGGATSTTVVRGVAVHFWPAAVHYAECF